MIAKSRCSFWLTLWSQKCLFFHPLLLLVAHWPSWLALPSEQLDIQFESNTALQREVQLS